LLRQLGERLKPESENNGRPNKSPADSLSKAKASVSHEWICHKRYGKFDRRETLVNQISIEQRPAAVEQKNRLGDWELDTISGKAHRQAIVSMTERKSKLLKIKKVSRKTGNLVKQAICQKLADLTVRTLTSDNGREFSEHAQIACFLKASFYFCHPYSSWE
jgi:IS30 family transposase